ncbi:MAG: hypothetical protein K2N89_12270 [Lachnospiraceae bacterium]|nr:hypothetical protein [Lachnospiraceae bacterium]
MAPYDSLDAVIRYAKCNYERYKEDYEDAVKYRNRTIVELLDITEEEQRHMKQLIGQKEADKRAEESGKKKIENQMKKKRKNTEQKVAQLKEEMLGLRYHELLDNKQIALKVGKNERTVDR